MLLAAFELLAPELWAAVLLGVVIGFAIGTWTLVPAALIGAVVARAIPRWADRIAAD